MPKTTFSFSLKSTQGRARLGELVTPHGRVATPAFMPVATQATVKTLTPEEVRELGTGMLLCNAYHLYLRPGVAAVERLGAHIPAVGIKDRQAPLRLVVHDH